MSKTVVIGASSGLGRCIGVGLAERGDRVALLARRRERIETAAKEAGQDAVAVECDVTDEASVRSAISAAADGLGGIDNLVYTPAIGSVMRLVDTDAETWARVFATNVTGAAVATAAAVPYLTESAGKVVYLSSDAGTYRSAVAWARRIRRQQGRARTAHRGMARRASRRSDSRTSSSGECAGGDGDSATGFSTGWDRELAGEFYPQWISRGCMPGQLMPVEDLVEVVHTILRTNTATSMPVVVARGAPSRSITDRRVTAATGIAG